MHEWQKYRDTLADQIRESSQYKHDQHQARFGKQLTREELEAMSEEQVGESNE